MAAADDRPLDHHESGLRGCLEPGVEVALPDVAFGFGKQHGCSGFAGDGYLDKEPASIGKFVHHRKSQREIDRTFDVR